MANQQHVDLLKRDVDEWNEWRARDPKVKPDLSGADLRKADLVLANLSGGVMTNADLVLANMRGADLRKASLCGANLVGARMLGVDLVQADLSGADLSTAEDLTQEQIDQTTCNGETKLPEGLEIPRRPRAIKTKAGT